MYVVVVVVAAAALVACARNGVLAQPVNIEWGKSVQICGSRLTDFVVSICKTDSYGPETTDHVPTNRRQKRKIIEECCKVACTYGHIYENYCDHRVYDAETEYVPPGQRPTTRRIDHAADGTPVSTTSAAAAASPAAGPAAGSATSTVAPTTTSWFERFLNRLKFW